MSERTAENKKLELTMGILMVVVVAVLAIPIAISFSREVAFVSLLIEAVPFVLIAIATVSVIWARKCES